MHKPILAISLAVACSSLVAGCSRYHIPSPADLPIVYKIDVQQGNVVTQDMLARLEPGMDKAKVRYVMGTPLIKDVFHDDRWDYIYTDQKRGGKRTERRISLFFKNGKLDHIEGNVKAAPGAIAVVGRRDTTLNVPAAKKSLVTRLKDKFESRKKSAANAGKAAGEKQATEATAQAGGTAGSGTGKTSGTDKKAAAGKAKTAAKAAAAKQASNEVEVPKDAPRPHKSFLKRLLEKVGVGDNEGGEYQPGDTKYRDPTNPDTNPASAAP